MSLAQRLLRNILRGSIILAMSVSFLQITLAQSPSDDIVRLKNGTEIRGTVFERVPKSYIKIKTLEGKVQKYKFSEISSIEKAGEIKSEVKKEEQVTPANQPKAETKPAVQPARPQPVPIEYSPQAKSPTTAFLLSFILPGGGQYYNGQYTKGAIMTGSAIAGAVLVFAAGYEDYFVRDDYYYASYGYWQTETTTWLYVGGAIWIGASIWSMIDAPISAKKINEGIQHSTMGHMMMFEKKQYLIGCDLIPIHQGAQLRTVIYF